MGFASPAIFAQQSPTLPEPAVHLPASGQTETYPADRADGRAGSVPVADDGHVRAGAPLRYEDTGDGTITDLTTGLIWEKKCSGCDGLHDLGSRYCWSGDGTVETIWDWLRQVNEEGENGFAGRSDWRIPNVMELVSILDYGQLDPAVSEEFRDDRCERGCADPKQLGCSCTEPGKYWTATTFADFPAHAYVVFFGMGLVDDRVKTDLHYVRAVRGGRWR